MMVKRIKTIGSDGLEYTIKETEPRLDASHLKDAHATIAGMGELFLDGSSRRVNSLRDGTYQIIDNEVVLTPI